MFGVVYALGKVIEGGSVVGLRIASVEKQEVRTYDKEAITNSFLYEEVESPQIEVSGYKVRLREAGQRGSKPAVIILNEIENYGYKVIGTDEVVRNIKNEDVESFFNDRKILNGVLKGNRIESVYEKFELITDVELDRKIMSYKAKCKIVGAKVPNIRVVGNEVVMGRDRYILSDYTRVPELANVIGKNTFRDCRSVTNIEIPSTIRRIEVGAFRNSGITDIEIPESVTSIGVSTFESCEDLQLVEFKGVIERIPDGAFIECQSLTNVKMQRGLKSIGKEAFSSTRIYSPELPSTLKRIEDRAFEECFNLGTMVIPRSVEFIGEEVFKGSTIAELFIPRELPYDSTYLGVEEKRVVRY